MKISRPPSNQPLPKNAKKVFKGVIFDVYQWQQKMFDGTTQTFEKLKRTDTILIVPITTAGKIVLAEEEQPGKKPFIGVPGGRKDEDEEVIECAKRELMEETGMEAKEFVVWKAFQPMAKIDWSIFILVAKGCTTKSGMNLDAGEKISLKTVDFDKFIEISSASDFNDFEIRTLVLEARVNSQKMEQIQKLFFSQVK